MCTFSILTTESAFAQTKTVQNQQQIWMGYMTSIKVSKHYALWNDLHYAPNGFFVARTGLTYSNNSTFSLTAGYAFLLLPVSQSDTRLKRNEHRPWAQAVFTLPVAKSISLIQRIRYDARFIEDLSQSHPEEAYRFNNRIRFMTTLRKTFGNTEAHKYTPYVALADEVLINFGENITSNIFNQNRIMIAVGLTNPEIQYQIGYMSRFVQVGVSQYVNNHTLVIWVTQRFSIKKKDGTSK